MLKYIMNFGDSFKQSIFLYGASRNIGENKTTFYKIRNNDDGEYANLKKLKKGENIHDNNYNYSKFYREKGVVGEKKEKHIRDIVDTIKNAAKNNKKMFLMFDMDNTYINGLAVDDDSKNVSLNSSKNIRKLIHNIIYQYKKQNKNQNTEDCKKIFIDIASVNGCFPSFQKQELSFFSDDKYTPFVSDAVHQFGTNLNNTKQFRNNKWTKDYLPVASVDCLTCDKNEPIAFKQCLLDAIDKKAEGLGEEKIGKLKELIKDFSTPGKVFKSDYIVANCLLREDIEKLLDLNGSEVILFDNDIRNITDNSFEKEAILEEFFNILGVKVHKVCIRSQIQSNAEGCHQQSGGTIDPTEITEKLQQEMSNEDKINILIQEYKCANNYLNNLKSFQEINEVFSPAQLQDILEYRKQEMNKKNSNKIPILKTLLNKIVNILLYKDNLDNALSCKENELKSIEDEIRRSNISTNKLEEFENIIKDNEKQYKVKKDAFIEELKNVKNEFDGFIKLNNNTCLKTLRSCFSCCTK